MRNQSGEETAAYYWRTYYEWRIAYGVQDECMIELIAAVQVALEQTSPDAAQTARLRQLIDVVEAERRLALACVA